MRDQSKRGEAAMKDERKVRRREEEESEKKKRKLQRVESGGCDGGSNGIGLVTGGESTELPQELVLAEVLTRLSCRPLMRFRCVSKLWCSSMDDDWFRKVHYSRSRSRIALLIVCRDIGGISFCTTQLGLGLGLGSGQKEDGVLELDFLPHFHLSFLTMNSGITEVINGMFCFYDGHTMGVCKISTGSILELPPCFNYLGRQEFKFYFGFDCTRKEYKLLKVWFGSVPGSDVFTFSTTCKILTLGKDADWRSIPTGPEINIWVPSVYLDGSSTLCFWCSTGGCLVAFSFREEGFGIVDLPPFGYKDILCSLHKFRGHLALAEEFVDGKLEFWVYGGKMPAEKENMRGEEEVDFGEEEDDRSADEEEEYPPIIVDNLWTKHIIDIPYAFGECDLFGILPTGDILLTGTHEAQEEQEELMPPFYSYDPTKEKFQKLVFNYEFPGDHSSDFRICLYDDDMTPLKDLLLEDESSPAARLV